MSQAVQHGSRRKWKFLGVSALLIAALFLAREPILLGVGNFLIIQSNLQPAELIHVLGGDVDRIDYGVQLYKQGLGKKLLLTGGRIEIPLADTTYARLAFQYAVSKGVKAGDILPPDSTATSTYEEAIELKAELEKMGSVKSVIIVSSPFHMRRARWIFEKTLQWRVQLQYAPVPFEFSRLKQRWWSDEQSLKAVVNEYLILPYYLVKYGFS